ncbi:MAG TPA: hypothetical protein VEH29_05410 [Acidimicrobiales bacterium]|nr:hypothetical protein [Acidimicrobiales bacterium]
MAHVPTRIEGRGQATAVRSWQVQSSVSDPAEATSISQPGYRPSGWYEAPARSTVMAALLHAGRFADLSYSTRLRDDVDGAMFDSPWWFRTTFRAAAMLGSHVAVRSDGIIPRADLWVNGEKVAGRDAIAGAYTSNTFDITHLVHPGENAVAYLVYPGGPMTDLSIGWVDWNQWPPDNNMGIWRDVVLLSSGPVRLARPRVTVELSPAGEAASLEISCDVVNLTDAPVVADLRLNIGGPTGQISLRSSLSLARGATQELRADTGISRPALWWPAGRGSQPLYELEVVAYVDGAVSDRAATSFGLRSVTSELAPGGGRWFYVNGQRVPIRGAGWSPDLFLRHDPQRIADELAYTLDIGLNTIRLEGKGENPEFFEMADERGLLVLPGWECCNKWEAHAGTGGSPWDEHDFDVAARSMEAEAFALGNHPCVIGFLLGSDFPPEPRASRAYVDALARARWDLPVISSATVMGTEEAGPSGMKMTGPYAWVPPVYWYRRDAELGGAVGFNSETSAGNNVPRLASLEKMLSPAELEQLWREPSAKQFHAGPPSEFDNLAIFHRALSARYGEPRSLRDFVSKAQLASYEATRAQFEAFGSRTHADEPATGVVYWMLNSAWPSLNWQLWDHYLDPAGAYFGTKKANEPVHIQYDYADRGVRIVNRTPLRTGALVATVRVRTAEGEVVVSRTADVPGVGAGETLALPGLPVEAPPAAPGAATAHFLELDLVGEGGEAVSRNVYWLSSTPDVLDVEHTTWQYTPTASFADLRGLERLPAPALEATAAFSCQAGLARTSLTIANVSPGGPPAVGLHASLRSSAGTLLAPVIWSENEVTLFGGQSAHLTAECALAALVGAAPSVEVDAFNLSEPLVVVAQQAR